MTTDAWKSFAKQSYITLTCHIIDHNGQLLTFLLSTTEMKQRHTSENLRQHIQSELVKWGLESDTVTTNFNSTNENDIEAETEDIHNEVDFLQEVGYYREEEDEPSDKQLTTTISTLIDMEEYTQMSQDSTQMSQEDTQMSQDITQMSQEETDRSHVWNVISETGRSHVRNVIFRTKTHIEFYY